MKTVIALVAFSNDDLSMYKGQIMELDETTADALIDCGYVAEYVKDFGEPFVVEMTLTSDSGGTMDKTNVEILDAYTKGKTIMFSIDLNGISCRVQATLAAAFEAYDYPSFNALAVDTDHHLVNLFVDPSDEESNTFTMALEDLGGGSGDSPTMVVTLVKSDNTYSIDKTVDEIRSFVSNGGVVLVNDTEKNVILNRLRYTGSHLVFQATFIEEQNYPSITSDRITLRTLLVYVSNGTCSVSEKHYELTPETE